MSFYFLLSMFIHWNSSVIKTCPFLPIYLFNYVSMNSGILTLFYVLKSNAIIIHFVAQIVPTLAIRRELLQVGSWVLSAKPPTFFEHFLVSSTTKMFHAYLYFPSLGLESTAPPKKKPILVRKGKAGCSLLLGFHCQAYNLDKPAPLFASLRNSLAENH